MVRVWHPDIIPIIDDKRLPAAHNEAHMILAALERKKGWWKHPETQIWVGRADQLRGLHDQAAEEMLARGYNHKSPVEGVRNAPCSEEWFSPIPDYKETWITWFLRDLADLYVKWSEEGRIEGHHVERGQPDRKGSWHPFKGSQSVAVQQLEAAFELVGPREYTPEQQKVVKELAQRH